MRIVKIDKKENFLQLVPEINDDLWHLERIIEKHDFVSGSTDRKIKPKVEGEKPERMVLFVTLDVESVEFHRFSGKLRISGKIVEGKPAEFIEFGAQQALEIELGNEVKIKKPALKQYQIDRLKKAEAATKKGKILLVVMDDEQASFALLREFELEEITSIRSHKSGKSFKAEETMPKYFSEILEKISSVKPEVAIAAGPGFAKENFERYLKEKGSPKGTNFFFFSTNSVGKTGLQEILKGNELNRAVQEMQLVKETRLVELFLAEIGKNSGLAEYGLEEVRKAVEAGAVKVLLVSDKKLLEEREKVEELMQKAEQTGAEVHLVNAEHESGKQLGGLGGIAAILRYRTR